MHENVVPHSLKRVPSFSAAHSYPPCPTHHTGCWLVGVTRGAIKKTVMQVSVHFSSRQPMPQISSKLMPRRDRISPVEFVASRLREVHQAVKAKPRQQTIQVFKKGI